MNIRGVDITALEAQLLSHVYRFVSTMIYSLFRQFSELYSTVHPWQLAFGKPFQKTECSPKIRHGAKKGEGDHRPASQAYFQASAT